MAEKYDDVLVPFVSLMRRELHANAGKGDRPGWLRMDANTALLEVYYHLAKLQKAVKHNDGPAIMEYSADVANMAMMVLDVCGGLAWVGADCSSCGGTGSQGNGPGVGGCTDCLGTGHSVAVRPGVPITDLQKLLADAHDALNATKFEQGEVWDEELRERVRGVQQRINAALGLNDTASDVRVGVPERPPAPRCPKCGGAKVPLLPGYTGACDCPADESGVQEVPKC